MRPTQGRGNPRPECGSGGVPEEDDSAHVTLFERKAGNGCTDGDEVRIVALSDGQIGQVQAHGDCVNLDTGEGVRNDV